MPGGGVIALSSGSKRGRGEQPGTHACENFVFICIRSFIIYYFFTHLFFICIYFLFCDLHFVTTHLCHSRLTYQNRNRAVFGGLSVYLVTRACVTRARTGWLLDRRTVRFHYRRRPTGHLRPKNIDFSFRKSPPSKHEELLESLGNGRCAS